MVHHEMIVQCRDYDSNRVFPEYMSQLSGVKVIGTAWAVLSITQLLFRLPVNGCHSFEQPLVEFSVGVLHVHIILIACERLSKDSFGLG